VPRLSGGIARISRPLSRASNKEGKTGREFLAAPSSGLINCSYPFLASFAAEEASDGRRLFSSTLFARNYAITFSSVIVRGEARRGSLMYPQVGKEGGRSCINFQLSRLDADYFILRSSASSKGRNGNDSDDNYSKRDIFALALPPFSSFRSVNAFRDAEYGCTDIGSQDATM